MLDLKKEATGRRGGRGGGKLTCRAWPPFRSSRALPSSLASVHARLVHPRRKELAPGREVDEKQRSCYERRSKGQRTVRTESVQSPRVSQETNRTERAREDDSLQRDRATKEPDLDSQEASLILPAQRETRVRTTDGGICPGPPTPKMASSPLPFEVRAWPRWRSSRSKKVQTCDGRCVNAQEKVSSGRSRGRWLFGGAGTHAGEGEGMSSSVVV